MGDLLEVLHIMGSSLMEYCSKGWPQELIPALHGSQELPPRQPGR